MAVIQGRGQLTDRTFPTNPRRDNKDMELQQEWKKQLDLSAEATKLYAEGYKLIAEGDGLYDVIKTIDELRPEDLTNEVENLVLGLVKLIVRERTLRIVL